MVMFYCRSGGLLGWSRFGEGCVSVCNGHGVDFVWLWMGVWVVLAVPVMWGCRQSLFLVGVGNLAGWSGSSL